MSTTFVNYRAQWAQTCLGWGNKLLLLLLAQVIGAALDRIGTYNDLDNKQHVIALIDPEMCINCGEPPFFRHLLHFLLHLSTWIYPFLSTLLIDRQENATWRATIRATRRYLSTNKRTFPRSRVTMKWYLSCWWNCFVLLQKNQLWNPYWHDAVYSQIQWTVGTKCVKHAI